LHQPLSYLSAELSYKVFVKALYERLLLHANAIAQHYQAEFQSRKSLKQALYSLPDHIFIHPKNDCSAANDFLHLFFSQLNEYLLLFMMFFFDVSYSFLICENTQKILNFMTEERSFGISSREEYHRKLIFCYDFHIFRERWKYVKYRLRWKSKQKLESSVTDNIPRSKFYSSERNFIYCRIDSHLS
jgi:hypothetical protein